jgi:hypothetical protein
MLFFRLHAFLLACLGMVMQTQGQVPVYDLVIYGGTSAAVTAAVQARQMGRSVILVSPDKHLGGLTSGGLGWTDTGNKSVIGGLSRAFYHRVWKHYQQEDAWPWQGREDYGNRGQGTPAIDGQQRTMWIFEPHVAESVFETWLGELDIPVHRDQWLDREPGMGVVMEGRRIRSIRMLSGRTYRGRMFVDATYEGDLMAAAGMDYHVGREGSDVYGETWNGVQTGVLHHRHHFGTVARPISPYRTPGDPASGVLPRISVEPPGIHGTGDHRIQAYCFRMCLTDHPENQIPFPMPEGYDPGQYALLLRVFEAGWRETFHKFDPIPNRKTDTNNHGPFSTDNIGFNYDYPEATYARRREIIQEHAQYQKGLMYFVANDPGVPVEVRRKMASYGLSRDEFMDNGGWPHQIYVRESRRMIGDFVMTEHELLKRRPTLRSVGMGSYTMDSHNVQRYITPEGHVQNEGDIGVSTQGPYAISYDSLLPKKDQCQNLLVPVCISSSHIAFGSIRMEPVFMILGQSAATAAMLCLESGKHIALQDLPYERLKKRLIQDGQVLESGAQASFKGIRLTGVVVDDLQADRSPGWSASHAIQPCYANGYLHDRNQDKGQAWAHYKAPLQPGVYEVRMTYTAHGNRASNVPVEIHHRLGVSHLRVNQRRKPEIDGIATSLGSHAFDEHGKVVVRNGNTDGYVVLDAVQWIRH